MLNYQISNSYNANLLTSHLQVYEEEDYVFDVSELTDVEVKYRSLGTTV